MARNGSSGQPSWGIPMAMGMLMIAGGTFALFAAVLTSIMSVLYIGAMLVAVGALEIVTAFRVRHGGPFVMFLLAGLLALVVGALLLYRPLAGMASLTLLVACYMFASGLFRGITAIADRYQGWGWDFAYGIIAVLIGGYVVASWPISSLWVLGTVVGVEIVVRGFTLVAVSWLMREIEHGTPHPAA
ncbi:MAG TPA: DUF308 domain-containing protein [Gemmatimonadaceae bacterium]